MAAYTSGRGNAIFGSRRFDARVVSEAVEMRLDRQPVRGAPRLVRFVVGVLCIAGALALQGAAGAGTGRAAEAGALDAGRLARPGGIPVNGRLPEVTGPPRQGSVLVSSLGTWAGTKVVRYTVRWRRCSPQDGKCSSIRGAASPRYVVRAADVGKSLRSAVTARGPAGAATALSSSSPVVVRRGAVVPRPVLGTGIQRLGDLWPRSSGYERYAYVIVGRSAASAAAAQPGTSLVYQSGTSVNVAFDTGVPYPVASANGWLLKDGSGAYLKNLDYPDNFIGDVGNPAYQAEWARRVSAYVAAVGVDGVYIDDVVGDIFAMSHTYPAKYPDQRSWENAMASFVQVVGRVLESRGFYVLVNAHKWIAGVSASDDGSLEAGWWRRLAPFVSGLHSENWVQAVTIGRLRAGGPEWWNGWDGWQGLVGVAQKAGVDFFGFTYGSPGDAQAMRYGKASFLLDWNGRGGAFMFHSTDGSDPWRGEWTADVGRPVAAKVSPAPGVWTRRFERATVVLNSTLSPVSLAVAGGLRTIGPRDALILPS